MTQTDLQQRAEQGDAEAQHELGLMYADGDGVPKNEAEAAKWLRKAAEQGHEVAQCDLGFMYALGTGVPKNDVEAVKWFRMAAEQGYAPAQHELGCAYRDGEGVPQNDAEAAKWFSIAAEQWDADVQEKEQDSSPLAVPVAKKPAFTWAVGSVILDDYLIEGELGRGGMGRVWLVKSKSTGRRFAVKQTLIKDDKHRKAFLTTQA